MIIKITNNSTTAELETNVRGFKLLKAEHADYPSAVEISNCQVPEVDTILRAANNSADIDLELTLEDGDSITRTALMIDTADVTGGGTTAAVGFDMVYRLTVAETNYDIKVNGAVQLRYGAYTTTDALGSTNGTIGTATSGSFETAEDVGAALIETSAAGEFRCTLTDAVDETNIMVCTDIPAEPDILCGDTESVAFSA